MKDNASMPRSLIVGAHGQVGHQLLTRAGAQQSLATARVPLTPDWLKLDLATIERDSLLTLLEPHRIDAVYCVGGMTNVELCESEPELAMRTNCSGPAVLASVAQELQVPFVYFSTEYVFDGEDGPYLEDATVNPISAYGKSKWRGEQAVMEACSNALILRTTVVYGADEGKKNFLYGLRRALLQGERFRVPQDQISTPTYNADLADATFTLARSGATGCFHVCGPELFGRGDFAKAAAAFWGLDADLIQEVPTSQLGQRARRPLQAGLLTEKLATHYPEIVMGTLNESLARWQLDEPTHVSAEWLERHGVVW